MPALAKRKYEGQSGDYNSTNDRQSEPYVVTGAENLAEAITAVLGAAAATITTSNGGTLYQLGVTWEFLTESTDMVPVESYEITVNYGPQNLTLADLGVIRVSYDTSGGSIHTTIAHSETVYPSQSGGDAVTFHNVIGNQEDSADGTDIPVPQFKFTVTKVFAVTGLPDPGDVFYLTGRCNDASFSVTDTRTGEVFNFQESECVFEGARKPESRADGRIEMSFQFSAQPNVVNQTVGPITGIDKKGAQYAWVRYATTPEGLGANRVAVTVPKFVVVNDVLLSGNFGLLRIS